jgi:replicative DNA helicase
MPNFEKRLLTRATYDTNYEAVFDAGITEEMFLQPESRRVFSFAAAYYREHRSSPTPRVMKLEFPGYKLLDPGDVEPLSYCVERVRKDYAQHRADQYGDLAGAALDAKDPGRFFEVVAEAARFTAANEPAGKTVSMADLYGKYLDIWDSRANAPDGLIGIPAGFPTIDKATLGFQPQQLVTIAGLAGAGKSTLLMRMAREAQKKGFTSYFMSFEMNEEEQFGRYVAMEINVPYNKLISGKITADERERYKLAAERAAETSMFTLCTDIARSSTVPGLRSELEKKGVPQVAFIDGVYLMRDHQTKMSGADWNAMTNITREMKTMAQHLEIPVVMSTQALMSKTSRGSSKTHRRLDMYSPGYSSSFAQDSDVMFALEKDENEPFERIIRVTKARHAAPHAVRVRWEWATATFGVELETIEGEEEIDEDDIVA